MLLGALLLAYKLPKNELIHQVFYISQQFFINCVIKLHPARKYKFSTD